MRLKLLIHLLLVFAFFNVNGQKLYNSEKLIHPNDSITLINLPKLSIPDFYKGSSKPTLPSSLNNGELPYLRPIFSQYGYSCGQASSIGYNYTYELNRINNTPATSPTNQLAPLFTWNFFNNGLDDVGVCYHYTFNTLKHAGNVNVYDFGDLGDNPTHWPSGYDKYYNAMFHRINQAYSIYVGDEEGLQTLKYWLYDHMEETEFGGLANFYTDQFTHSLLPPGTPDSGKAVITNFGSYTGHSMTFIGWNDSIRWDYNEDGQYTNNIDITGDGEVTMLDWEIGGLRIVNSHGDDWADSGFAYLMYRVIAQEKLDGGIWNKSVHVFNVKEDYEPLLTYKVEFKHNSRNKVKFLIGVSNDTTDVWPQYTVDYPIFNFQGGDHFMQGYDTDELYKTIEVGLDATPLLSHINPGDPARFFFQVQENDPYNKVTGLINSFAVMDYLNGGLEIPSPQTNVPIVENGVTTVSVVHTASFDKIQITDEELPAFTPGQNYSYQLSAEGGTEPYTWDIITPYNVHEYSGEYPLVEDEQLFPGGYSNEYVTKQIDFSFPFYGNLYDSVTMHIDGFIMFDKIAYPLPYQVDDMLLFKYESMIAPFLNQDIMISNSNGDGLWYEGNEDYAAFRWNVTLSTEDEDYPLDFVVKLYPDGEINFFFDEFDNSNHLHRITGISNGDDINYEISGFSQLLPVELSVIISYVPGIYLANIEIDNSGLLSINPDEADKIYDISVRATDFNNISTTKSFQLSDGIIFNYSILSGNDNQIDYGETVYLGFEIKNIGDVTLTNMNLNFMLDDPHITILDDTETFGPLDPGQSVILQNAISFEVSTNIQNNYDLAGIIEIDAGSNFWEGKINMRGFAPKIDLGNPVVMDNDNGRLDPGETTDIVLPVNNIGSATAFGVSGTITTNDEFITFNTSNELEFGDIQKNDVAFDTFNITVNPNTPMGYLANFETEILVIPSLIVQDSFKLLVGRYPVLIVDMDPEQASAPIIKSTMEELDVLHDFSSYLPNNLDIYQNIFISLGRIFQQYILTDFEGQLLADFLNSGGNVYMEGAMTWSDDPQTIVHPMFNISAEANSWNYIDPVSGSEGTFTESMWFEYNGAISFYDNHLIPVNPAFSILGKNDENQNLTIANDASTYKTVGSNIDFGGLVDNIHPSTKKNLLAKILIFFGQDVVITEIKEGEIGLNSSISCFPNPFSSHATLQFSLAEEGAVNLSIHDAEGRLIEFIYRNKKLSGGDHQYSLGNLNLHNGIYLCNFQTKTTNSSIRIVIIK